jgi:hypothetical protein
LNKVSYIFIIFFVTVIPLNFLYGEREKYSYDYSDPRSVVNSACQMLMNSDYEEMLNVTEMMEKKRTIATIEALTNQKVRDLLIKESGRILNYEMVGIEDFTNDVSNQLMVVTVKWTLKNDTKYLETNPITSIDRDQNTWQKKDEIIYTDYLLKKINEKWKIISKKSK